MARDHAVEALAAEEFDIAVIGGGIRGAGVALDAASRGLSVALVEARDFASENAPGLLESGPEPWRGLRVRGIRETLAESERMLELAPRIVRPLPLVLPRLAGARRSHVLRAQLALSDLLAPRTALRHRRVSGAEAAELVPVLAGRRPESGLLIGRIQVDEARLVLSVLAEAERRGAVCCNRLETVRVLGEEGRVAALEAHDLERGGHLTIAADHVVDTRTARAGGGRAGLLLSLDDLPLNGAGLLVRGSGGGRLTGVPWAGRALVRGSETPQDGLHGLNSSLGTALRREHVTTAFAGAAAPGALASWRPSAARAVDRLLARAGRLAPSRTREIGLAARVDPRSLDLPSGSPPGARSHLANRYGPAAAEVAAIARAHPQSALPIVDGWPDLVAEAVYAARHEQARSVGDVLLRRTRLGVLAAPVVREPGGTVAHRVARALAPELGWSDCRTRREASAWLRDAQEEAHGA